MGVDTEVVVVVVVVRRVSGRGRAYLPVEVLWGLDWAEGDAWGDVVDTRGGGEGLDAREVGERWIFRLGDKCYVRR